MGEAAPFPILTVLVLLPLVGAGLCLVIRRSGLLCRALALVTTLAVLGLAIWQFLVCRTGSGWLRFEDFPWIERLGVRFTIGMDGLSLLMVLLTAFLLVIAVLLSWRDGARRRPLFFALLLLIESGILGVFLALDLIVFYVFWEVMLIPMFFLIGVFGHGRRVYAAVKFFLFTLAGSLLMLFSILSLYFLHGQQTGEFTFALEALKATTVPADLGPWLYGAFLLAFAVKVPLVPLHTWLPDAHTEAPTAGSVLLAGLLLKTGVYGLIRFGFPLFPGPAQASLPLLSTLALVGIFYGAAVAFVQRDVKRVVAYSSVAHLGLVVLGLTAGSTIALEGSLLQMVNHGITAGALFAMVGMIEQRAKTRQLDELGGLWGRIPVLSFFFLFFALAAMALPGLNNFSGEILILVGTFRTHPWLGALAAGGIVFASAYLLRLIQGVLWGSPKGTERWQDLTFREGLVVVPLAMLVIWLGLAPAAFQNPLREVVKTLLGTIAPLGSAGGLP